MTRRAIAVATEVLTPSEAVTEYFRMIDSGDLDAAFALFADQAEVRFMDEPPIRGRDSIVSALRAKFTPLVKTISHETMRRYEVPQPDETTTVICEQTVTYVMLRSGNVLSHNGVSIVEVDNASGQITAQRNVGNLGPVLADHEAHAPAKHQAP